MSTEKDYYCTGCLENVNVNAEGVPVLVNTALKHLETERDNIQSAIEVLTVQRQVSTILIHLIKVCQIDTFYR